MAGPDEKETALSVETWLAEAARADPPARSVRLSSKDKLGRYEIQGLLSAGGMGQVYQAFDVNLQRVVAIKVAAGQTASEPGRFAEEARAMAALSHPNVVTVFDFGVHEGLPFIVMELLRGETLRSRMRRSYAVWEALSWAADLIRGLAAVHGAGLLHLDLKPENVFLTDDGTVKLLDFGISKFFDRATPGTVEGTAAYMSPEQLMGLAPDVRSDVFGLGVMLTELLRGKHPFRDRPGASLRAAILEQPAFEHGTDAGWPTIELRDAVVAALEKDPAARPTSIAPLGAAIDDARRGRTRSSVVQYLERPRGQIAYRVIGAGDETCVIVSGLVSDVDMWDREPEGRALLSALASGRRVIVYDRIGLGASERVPAAALPTLSDEVEDLLAVCDANGARAVHLIALGEGVPLAIAAGSWCRERVRGLVLVSGDTRVTPRGREAVDSIVRSWGTAPEPGASQDEERLATWLAAWQRASASSTFVRSVLEHARHVDVRDLLPWVGAPIAIVRRPHDRLSLHRANALRRLCSDAKLYDSTDTSVLPFCLDSAIPRALADVVRRSTAVRSAPLVLLAVVQAHRSALGGLEQDIPLLETGGARYHRTTTPEEALRHAKSVIDKSRAASEPARVVLLAASDLDAATSRATALLELTAPYEIAVDESIASALRATGARQEPVVEWSGTPPRRTRPSTSATLSVVPPASGLAAIAPLSLRTFTIDCRGPAHIALTGSLTPRDPSVSIIPHFRQIHAACEPGGRITVDVTRLRTVNSSALGLFLHWIGWVRDAEPSRRYRLVFVWNRRVAWQRANLAALRSLAPDVVELQEETRD